MLRQSPLLEESGRSEPIMSEDARVVASAVNLKSCFTPSMSKCGLEPEQIEGISNPKWTAGTAESWRDQGALTLAWASSANDYDAMRGSWLSALVQPGHVILHRERSAEPFLVLSSCARYALLWRLWAVKTPRAGGGDDYRWLRIAPQGKEEAEYECKIITDTDNWRMSRLVCRAPVELKTLGIELGHAQSPQGLALEPVEWTSLLVGAAREAFATMSVVHLKQLMASLPVKYTSKRMPTTERDVVFTLLRHILPDADEGELETIFKKRSSAGQAAMSDMSFILDGDNLEVVQAELDDDEVEDVKRLKAKSQKISAHSGSIAACSASVGVPGAAAGKPAASSSSGEPGPPPGASRQPTTTRVPEADDYDVVAYRRFLPVGVRCSLVKDIRWHNRWTASYLVDGKVRWRSSNFGPRTGLSVREALLVVLRWVWERHTQATGDPCPHDLEA